MKTSFREIHDVDIFLTDINAMTQHFGESDCYNFLRCGRPYDGLCLYTHGSAHYEIDTETFGIITMQASVGDLVCLPKGSRYKVRFSENTEDYLINFRPLDSFGNLLEFSDGCSLLFSDSPSNISDLFRKSAEISVNRINNTKNILKSNLFGIFDKISLLLSENEPMNYDKKLVSDITQYIKNHATEKLSIEELAKKACISERYLRTLFKKYAGTSPVKYKNKILIEYAKNLLGNGIMNVNETAEFLGYYDAAYFSKLFKKQVGVSPLEYVNTPYKAKENDFSFI